MRGSGKGTGIWVVLGGWTRGRGEHIRVPICFYLPVFLLHDFGVLVVVGREGRRSRHHPFLSSYNHLFEKNLKVCVPEYDDGWSLNRLHPSCALPIYASHTTFFRHVCVALECSSSSIRRGVPNTTNATKASSLSACASYSSRGK